MISKIAIVAVIIILVAGIFFLFKQGIKPVTTPVVQTSVPNTIPTPPGKTSILLDYGDQELSIEPGQIRVRVSDSDTGQFSAKMSQRVISNSGNEAAAIIIDSPGNAGPYYYVVGGMTVDGQQTISPPQSLGDKIKIISVSVEDPGEHDNGLITINILDRAPNSPEPTIKVTKKYAFQENGNLVEVLH